MTNRLAILVLHLATFCVLFLVACSYIASIFMLGGGRYLNFDLTRGYDFRSDASGILPGAYAYSKLTLGLMEYGYPLDIAHLIGFIYHGDEKMSANMGWLGSGYMQAGFIGLLICTVIIAAIFKYIDACARASGDRVLITAAVAVPILALITSADLPTAFLTYGLYVNLLLIACFHGSNTSNAYSSLKQRASA